MKPLSDREAVLFCVAFDSGIRVGNHPISAAHGAIGRIERLRELAADQANSEEIRFYAEQIVESPRMVCWDGVIPNFKRVGPVEICERCQQSPADHITVRRQ